VKSSALRRSSRDSVVAGVCAGLARYFGLSVGWVRLGAVALAFLNGFGLLVYVLAWLLIPRENESASIIRRRPRRGWLVAAVALVAMGSLSLIEGVHFLPFWIIVIAVVVIALMKSSTARRRARPNLSALPRSAAFNQAKEAWRQRLEAHQLDSTSAQDSYLNLPSSLFEASNLWPGSTGFQPNPTGDDPFQLAGDGRAAATPVDPWALSPPSAASAGPLSFGPLSGGGSAASPSSAPSGSAAPYPTGNGSAPSSSPGSGSGPSASSAPSVPPTRSGPSAPSAQFSQFSQFAQPAQSARAAWSGQAGPAARSNPSSRPAAVASTGSSLVLGLVGSTSALGGLDAANGQTRSDRFASAGLVVAPIELSSFFAHPAPAPDTATGTVVASRRRHPVLVGWLVCLALIGGVGGLSLALGYDFYSNPYLVATSLLGLLGLALLASPWAGRPRWLSPLAGCLVALTALLPVLELMRGWLDA
jgi:phage shock protein C